LGRFISRDLLGYAAGDANLYRYVESQPLILLDPAGLQGGYIDVPDVTQNRIVPVNEAGLCAPVSPAPRVPRPKLPWIVLRRGDIRATAWARCGATVEDLAKLIGLSAQEYRKWLQSDDGMPLPASASTKMTEVRRFTVPNVGYIEVSSYGLGFIGWAMYGYDKGLTNKWLSDGLYVERNNKPTVLEVLYDLQSDDIYRFAYLGHGDIGGSLTALRPSDGRDWIIAKTYTRYGIAEMHLISCYSDDGAYAWKRNVSRNGFLRTIRGKGSVLNFWLGRASFQQQAGSR